MEVLAALAIVAVLLAISIPAITAVRAEDRRVACLANASSCGRSILSYLAENDESFPMFAEPRFALAFSNGGVRLGYFRQSHHWPLAFADGENSMPLGDAQLCAANPVLDEPEGPASAFTGVAQSDDYLAHGLISDPAPWSLDSPFTDERLLRPVRAGEVTHPSARGMLLERRAYHTSIREPHPGGGVPFEADNANAASFQVTLADGSARGLRPSALKTPGPYTLGDFGDAGPLPVLHTTDGARGRDLPR